MKWFWYLFDRWSAKVQRKELKTFVEILSAMDSAEIGPIVALVTHWRHSLKDSGYNVIDPRLCIRQCPELILFISSTVADFKRKNETLNAIAFTVWLHTIRASVRPELRGMARDMWGQLSRGFPHVDLSAYSLLSATGIRLNTNGYFLYPEGFSPKPD